MKEKIKDFVLGLGVDDVGFAAPSAYVSPKSFSIEDFLPGLRAIIVMVFKELSSCESPSMTAAMNGRLDLMSFERSSSYRIARFLEKEFKAKVASMPYSYPMELRNDRLGLADFSQRHAAVAAGLGIFGRHNLVIHPRFGSRIAISSLLTDLEIAPDPVLEDDLCIHSDLCVANCPASALSEEGKTDTAKCVKHSQPYGLRANVAFWTQLVDRPPEEQKNMFRDENYWRLYQAGYIGLQYFCFNCMKSCPIGQEE
jgi:epoxyqueuosine reductase